MEHHGHEDHCFRQHPEVIVNFRHIAFDSSRAIFKTYMFIAIIIISLYISIKDITERRIPNVAHFMILTVAYCYIFSHPGIIGAGQVLIWPFAMLLVGIILSSCNILGFGDTKLLFITMLVVPPEQYVNVIYLTVFMGGAWAILWTYALSKISLIKRYDKVRSGVPYAIPILISLCTYTFIGAV
ncbi:Flp pilus assembly protein, protease CpaA [Serratia marcescens]|nr:Flp pilus assembly protein, protease CpaA [Serratia marcescens]